MNKLSSLICLLLQVFITILTENISNAQEKYFFREGSDSTYYDQGIVDVNNLGQSTFEYTHPPDGPQWNDKVPCSTKAYAGTTSLKFNYMSSDNGNWRVSIYRSNWELVNLIDYDTISFYIYFYFLNIMLICFSVGISSLMSKESRNKLHAKIVASEVGRIASDLKYFA